MVYHKPVLLQPALDYLRVMPGAKYVDATYGAGGHAEAIRRAGGQVLGIDQDPQTDAQVHANFRQLESIVRRYNWQPLVGILLDLGVSQYQFGEAGRGFSIQRDGPLDMRMNPATDVTAAMIVNSWPVEQLTRIIKDFGEVPTARQLAQKILAARPLTTTGQLAVLAGNPDTARQLFQAVRIVVNDELGALQEVLPQARKLLASGGRLVIISFHSLEDRLVKRAMASWPDGMILTRRPVLGERNSKLRAWEKL